MGFQANVLKVMIASPSDVAEEREIVTVALYQWNNANAVTRKLVVQPVKWETHGSPQMGASAQSTPLIFGPTLTMPSHACRLCGIDLTLRTGRSTTSLNSLLAKNIDNRYVVPSGSRKAQFQISPGWQQLSISY